jgi:hypothetical protein
MEYLYSWFALALSLFVMPPALQNSKIKCKNVYRIEMVSLFIICSGFILGLNTILTIATLISMINFFWIYNSPRY